MQSMHEPACVLMFNACLAEGDAGIPIGLYELSLLSLGLETSNFEKTQRLDFGWSTAFCFPAKLIDWMGIFGEDLFQVLVRHSSFAPDFESGPLEIDCILRFNLQPKLIISLPEKARLQTRASEHT